MFFPFSATDGYERMTIYPKHERSMTGE